MGTLVPLRIGVLTGAAARPMSWVAWQGTQQAGFVSLVDEDHPLAPGTLPCLAELYVAPAWRGRGLGAALCRHVRAAAAEQGLPGLWLFTRHRQDYFRTLGWSEQADVVLRTARGPEWVTLMRG